jgi:hypothetical protein
MDYFSVSMLTKQSTNSSTEPLIMDNESESIDIPITDYDNHRRTSRSSLKNSDTWARKRALMQRGYEWTTTLDREHPTQMNDQITDDHLSTNIKSLPNSVTNSSTHTNEQAKSSSTSMATNSTSDSPSHIPSNLLRRRRSSRRLPTIPANSAIHTNSSYNDINISDDLTIASSSHSSTEYPSQPLRENSLGNRSNRSKSIDSESSLKARSLHTKLLHTHQTQNAKSIDVSNLTRQKSFLVVNNTLLPQRSLDYPCIVRKAQDLSDIVRRRMLYSKISKQQQGDSFSISLERDHVPKVPRKIIIRQDNSIEIALR